MITQRSHLRLPEFEAAGIQEDAMLLSSSPQASGPRLGLAATGKNYPPEFETLGTGYDVFGHYAFAGSTTQSLFNWQGARTAKKGEYDVPSLITPTRLSGVERHFQFGESALQLQSNFSSSVESGYDLPGMFSATVKSEISTSLLKKSKYVYSIYQLVIPLWKYSFDYRSAQALRLLNPEFKLAVQKYDPYELFRIYGTHFLSEIIIGGRLHFSSATKISAIQSDTDIQTTVSGSCALEMGSAEGSASVSMKQSIDSFNQNSETHLVSLGGEPAKALSIGTGANVLDNKELYEGWVNSVVEQPVFVDFGSRNALVPIWELVTDPKRKQKLHEAAGSYLVDLDGKNRLYSDRLVAVEVISGSNSGILAPRGYEKINYDLNRQAGGKFIYLCPAFRSVEEIQQMQDHGPIIDLTVVQGKGAPAPQGWFKNPVDLNQGAGGKYLYLCYQYGESGQIAGGIRDVAVVGGNSSHVPAPYGFKKISVDLNRGAGGDFIFLCYSKED